MIIFGTRPEAIKMCPLVLELKKRGGIQTAVCVTGQHRELLAGVLEVFGVVPDYDLAIMKEGQTLSDVTAGVLLGIDEILSQEAPDAVVVHGDTSTAFAALCQPTEHREQFVPFQFMATGHAMRWGAHKFFLLGQTVNQHV